MTCVHQMHAVCVYVCTYAGECVRVCTVQHSHAMVCLVSLLLPWVSGFELTLSGLCTKHFSEVGHFTSLFTSTLFRGVGSRERMEQNVSWSLPSRGFQKNPGPRDSGGLFSHAATH